VSADDIEAVMTIARGEGVQLVLVWVPRGESVVQMLATTDADARRALLEAYVEEIVTDCAEVVAAVDHPQLREHQDRLSQAIAAHQAGLHAAGQALSAVVVTALLQWVYGHGQLKKVRISPLRATDVDEQLLRDLKVAVLIEAAVPATEGRMDLFSDDQLPDRFNRNTTLPRVADRAYALPNAMGALMLVTGLLAEAQQLLEDSRRCRASVARPVGSSLAWRCRMHGSRHGCRPVTCSGPAAGTQRSWDSSRSRNAPGACGRW
jgi:hypothetical protein